MAKMPRPNRSIGKRGKQKIAGATQSLQGEGKRKPLLMKVRIPKYELPETRWMLERDGAIAQLLLKLPESPSRSQIINKFGMTPLEFDRRAKYLGPIVRALGKQMVINALLEMGRDTAMKKGTNLE